MSSNIDQKVDDAIADAIQKVNLTLPPSGKMSGNSTSTDINSQELVSSDKKANSNTNTLADYPGMTNFPTPSTNVGSPESNSEQTTAPIETQWLGGISEGNGDIPLTTPDTDLNAKRIRSSCRLDL